MEVGASMRNLVQAFGIHQKFIQRNIFSEWFPKSSFFAGLGSRFHMLSWDKLVDCMQHGADTVAACGA